MKMVEGLEGKGFHMQLNRGEAKLGDHLRSLTRQVSSCSRFCFREDGYLLIIVLSRNPLTWN